MSPVEVTIDRAHLKQNECWRERHSAPLSALVVVCAETLIQQRISWFRWPCQVSEA